MRLLSLPAPDLMRELSLPPPLMRLLSRPHPILIVFCLITLLCVGTTLGLFIKLKLKDLCLINGLSYASLIGLNLLVSGFSNEGSVLAFEPAYWFLFSFS